MFWTPNSSSTLLEYLIDEMQHQKYAKLSSIRGSKYKASTIRQSKGSGRGCGRGRAITSATSLLVALQYSTEMIRYTCEQAYQLSELKPRLIFY